MLYATSNLPLENSGHVSRFSVNLFIYLHHHQSIILPFSLHMMTFFQAYLDILQELSFSLAFAPGHLRMSKTQKELPRLLFLLFIGLLSIIVLAILILEF